MIYQIGDELLDSSNTLTAGFNHQVTALLEVTGFTLDSVLCDLRYIAQVSQDSFRKSSVVKDVAIPFNRVNGLQLFSVLSKKDKV